MKKLVFISDTHGYHSNMTIPDGDILIHCGDLTKHGELDDVDDFNDWLGTLPHTHKIVIAGNHDWCFEERPDQARARLTNAIYLHDEAVKVAGIRFYGSPWQPWFCDWAFNLPRGPELAAKWELIPANTDLLITHGPPFGILDRTIRGDHAGCEDLLARVRKIQPRLHAFGHIHEAAGVAVERNTQFLNASTGYGEGTVITAFWDEAGNVQIFAP